jgi:hypothetical protein
MLLDGDFGVNIIIELARYNLKMPDQATTKLVGLIKDLKIYVYGNL